MCWNAIQKLSFCPPSGLHHVAHGSRLHPVRECLSLSHFSHTLTLTLTLTLTHSQTLSLSHTHTLSLPLSLSLLWAGLHHLAHGSRLHPAHRCETHNTDNCYDADVWYSCRQPPWRQPRGTYMDSLVNSQTNTTRMWWHMWEIDLRFPPWLPPGWIGGVVSNHPDESPLNRVRCPQGG